MVEFVSDSFTEASDTTLASHSPETGGAWDRIYGGTNECIVAGGLGYVSGANTSNLSPYVNVATPPSADYQVRGLLASADNTSNGDVPQLYARSPGWVDGGTLNGYFVRYVGNATSANRAWQLGKAVNNVTTLLGTFPQNITLNQQYDVKLVVQGSDLEAFVDGVSRITASDSSLTAAGYAGLGCRANGRIYSFVADTISGGETVVGAGLTRSLKLNRLRLVA